MHNLLRLAYIAPCVILGACSTADTGPPVGDDGSNTGTGNPADDPDAPGDTDGPDDAGSDGEADPGGGDLPPPDAGDGDGDAPAVCQKLDVLLVVDNSKSMAAEQEVLARDAPALVDGLLGAVGTEDIEFMVVSADGDTIDSPYPGDPTCTGGNCTCNTGTECCMGVCESPNTRSCYGMTCDLIDRAEACDFSFGAGRRTSIGDPGQDCGLLAGQRHFGAQAPDPYSTLACLSHVGTYGTGNEMPLGAVLHSLSEARTRPGGCNEGFLRHDAPLVLVFLTDEEDNGKSPGDPELWHQAVLDLKGGNPDAIAVLGIVGDSDEVDGQCGPQIGDDGGEPAPRLRKFVQSFGEQGVLESVCAPEFESAFASLAKVAGRACRAFAR